MRIGIDVTAIIKYRDTYFQEAKYFEAIADNVLHRPFIEQAPN